MKMFHEFEDKIYIRADDETYFGTRGDFEYEFGENLPALPDDLPPGFERIYEPGKRHAIQDRESVRAGGSLSWDFGDRAIEAIKKLCGKQREREEKEHREMLERNKAV